MASKDYVRAVNKLLASEQYKSLLAIIKGFRNGAVYGTKIRFPHALVMTFLFRRHEPLADQARGILKATYTHSKNLASFVFLYKLLTTSMEKLQSERLQIHSFIAAFIGGYFIWGNYNKVNEQMDPLGQLILLPTTNFNKPEILRLPKAYPSKDSPDNLIDILITLGTFFGVESKKSGRAALLSQCAGRTGYLYDFVLRAATLVDELIDKNGLCLYTFTVPESPFDVSLVAIQWSPYNPSNVKGIVVDSNGEASAITELSMPTTTIPLTAHPLSGALQSGGALRQLSLPNTTTIPLTANPLSATLQSGPAVSHFSLPTTTIPMTASPLPGNLQSFPSTLGSMTVPVYSTQSSVLSTGYGMTSQPIMSVAPVVSTTSVTTSTARVSPLVGSDVRLNEISVIGEKQPSALLTSPNEKNGSEEVKTPSDDSVSSEPAKQPKKRGQRLSRKRKAQSSTEYSCTSQGEVGKMVLQQVGKTPSVAKQLNDSERVNDQESVDELLDTAEKALAKSESITRQYLGSGVNTTLNDYLNSSGKLNSAIDMGTNQFSSEDFVNSLLATLSESDKEKIAQELLKCTPPEQPRIADKDEYTLEKLQVHSARLMTRCKAMYESNGSTVGSARPETKVDHYPATRAALKKNSSNGDSKRQPLVTFNFEQPSSPRKSARKAPARSILKPQLRNLKAKAATAQKSKLSDAAAAAARDIVKGQKENKNRTSNVKSDQAKGRSAGGSKSKHDDVETKKCQEMSSNAAKEDKCEEVPPPAHCNKPGERPMEVQSCPLDLSGKSRRSTGPMFVDGANDESTDSEKSEISSSILETQGSPTQPATPPGYVSPSVNEEAIEILDSDTSPYENTDRSEVEGDLGENTLNLSDSGSTHLSEMSTLTTESHGTFDSDNVSEDGDHVADCDETVNNVVEEADEESCNNTCSSPLLNGNVSVQQVEQKSGEAEQARDLNGSCNVSLNPLMEGDDEVVSGSDVVSRKESARLTLDDVVLDKDYETFKEKLFITSSPKAAPRRSRRKILKDVSLNSASSPEEKKQTTTKTRKRSYGLLYGPVNNPLHPDGWIKTRCPPDDEFLPDLVIEESVKRRSLATGKSKKSPALMYSGENRDQVSEEEDPLVDVSLEHDESHSTVPTAFSVAAEMRGQSGECTDIAERMHRRNMKMASNNATHGAASFYSDDMEIPQLIQMSMHNLHQQDVLVSFMRNMIEKPFDEDTVPELTPNAAIMLKHYSKVITREIKVFLDDNNIKLEPIHDTRLQKFHRRVTNAIVKVIPRRHLEYDHIRNTVKRLKQTDLGRWDNNSFVSFLEMYERLKIHAKHPVVNEEAFWKFFSDCLKGVGVRHSPEACARMEEALKVRYHAIRDDATRNGRDILIYNTMSQCKHLNPPSLGSSAQGSRKSKTFRSVLENVKQKRDSKGRFTAKNPTPTDVIDLTGDNAGPTASLPGGDVVRLSIPRATPQFVQPPMPVGHGSGSAAAVALYPALQNYAPVANSRRGTVASSLTEIATNSGEVTSALVNLSNVVTSYVQCKQEAEKSQYTNSQESTFDPDERSRTPPPEEPFFSPYINYPPSTSSSATKRKNVWVPPPLPPSPPMPEHVCTADCPSYCDKMYRYRMSFWQ